MGKTGDVLKAIFGSKQAFVVYRRLGLKGAKKFMKKSATNQTVKKV